MSMMRFPARAFAAAIALSALFTPHLASAAETELTVAFKRDRYSIDENRFAFTTRRPAAQIVETAVRPDASFAPAPLLFEDWRYEDRACEITLRDGVTFSDGAAFDADAAIAALKLYDKGRSDFLQIDPESFEKTGPLTFRFRSETGSALVIENMTHRSTSLFSTAANRAENPVGTGPYLFESYEPKSSLTVARNPNYRGEAPSIDRMTFRFIDDDQARLLALLSGEVDVVGEVTPQMLLSAPTDGSVVLHESRPIRYVALLVNLNGAAPFDILQDRQVRERRRRG